jgi:pyrroline-5-carboxylate reductase
VIELQFLGGGRMAEALLGGLLASSVLEASAVAVVEVVPSRRAELAGLFPGVEVREHPGPAEGVVVATKPGDVPGAVAAAAAAGFGRVLTIAAGVSTRSLEAVAGEGTPVVRAMPNTPALVGRGAAAICAGSAAGEADLEWAGGILGAVGDVVVVPERLMDAVTGLSGSGPAYLFLVAEAMVEAGVAAGLPRDIADRLTRQTLLGSATLLAGSDEDPGALRAVVTSPGGTTAAGLRALEQRAVRAAFIEAVEAATRRSAELG